MTRVSVKDAIAEQRKLVRELRVASPVDAATLAVAVARLKRWQKIGKPHSAKRAARIGTVRSALETLLSPCLKPGTNPALLARVAEHVVDLCDQQGKALKARHKKPGASLDKGEAMRNAWSSGVWPTKNGCATEYGPKVGLGFVAARRHLRGA
jgi:hypothetical protein